MHGVLLRMLHESLTREGRGRGSVGVRLQTHSPRVPLRRLRREAAARAGFTAHCWAMGWEVASVRHCLWSPFPLSLASRLTRDSRGVCASASDLLDGVPREAADHPRQGLADAREPKPEPAIRGDAERDQQALHIYHSAQEAPMRPTGFDSAGCGAGVCWVLLPRTACVVTLASARERSGGAGV